ncbi:O-antigen ligase family protein [uncultured Paraglaciecola sp.]|uniref:O-antigen ligase family protein n=1 Tax=uncultured Paraglaciecola sp. TaxID=1765024 RepID=UPI002593A8CA|nr:O-antigen ligase family protein [uncultured Paraglaciecola sp.]
MENVINKRHSGNLLYCLFNHTALILMILIIPFSGTELLGSNLLNISGAKPINLIGALLFCTWILKGAEFINFSSKIRAKAFLIFSAYLIIFSLEFFRSYLNLGILLVRNIDAFGDFGTSKFGYILSYYVRAIFTVFSFFYIINHIKNIKQIETIANIILFSIFMFSLFTLLISFELVISGAPRSAIRESFQLTFNFHYNTVGTLIMLGIPLALSRSLSHGKGWYIVFGTILIALLFTQSRGAILGGLAGVFAFFFFQRKISIPMLLSIIFLGLLGYLLSDYIIPLFSRGLESGDLSEISSGRIDSMWIPLIEELMAEPQKLLFGLGMFGMIMSDSYVTNFNFFQATHAHNAYLNLLADAGLIVLTLFLILFYYSTKKAFKYSKKINEPTYNALFSCAVAYSVSALTGRQWFPIVDNMLLYPVIALLVAYVICYRKLESDTNSGLTKEAAFT